MNVPLVADASQQSDVLKLMHTFPPPPPDFEPHTADATQLNQHGFPRRPHPQREDKLHKLWHRSLSKPVRYTTAELEIDPVLRHRDPLRRVNHDKEDVKFAPSGWGGVIVMPSSLGFDEPANNVFAQWTIPGVFWASNPNEPITAGFWVGLDGYTNGQVLQAGVAVTVQPNGIAKWWAWTEWYTREFRDPAVKIRNFEVSPGDTVSFLVCASQPNHGFVAAHNLTTGQATSVGIDARPGITSAGASAEWIVEGVSDNLPVFLPMTFGNCIAGTKNHSFDLSPNGIVTEIRGNDGLLTNVSITSPSTAVVEWENWT